MCLSVFSFIWLYVIGCGSSLFDFSHYRLDVDSSSTQLLSTPTSLLSLDSHFGERNTKQNYRAVALSLSHLIFSFSLLRFRACCTFFVALSCLLHFFCRAFLLVAFYLSHLIFSFSLSRFRACCTFFVAPSCLLHFLCRAFFCCRAHSF